jgi:hypothetical protein
MATKTLVEKIEALPPEKRAQVEHFVDDLASAPPTVRFPLELLEQIDADREALYRRHGLIDTDRILRDLRETGGR